jgi:hypothetical protein
VRFLTFLVIAIVGAQFIELFAVCSLADTAPWPFGQKKLGDWLILYVSCLAPVVGPNLVLILFGLGLRSNYWTLWCVTLCAGIYAAFVGLGLLAEYGMAKAAAEAAARGSKYMNCAAHPRLFFYLFALPYLWGTGFACAAVLCLEAAIATLWPSAADTADVNE